MLRLGGSLVLCLGLAGCNLIFGIEEGELSAPTGASGGGGTGGTAGGPESGGGGAGAGGAAGGGGTGGSSSCEDGTACYTGDPADLVPGALCKQGTWSNCSGTPTCVGEVPPSTEDLTSPGDEDCDGRARGDFVFARELDSVMGATALYAAPGGGVVLVSTSGFLNLDDEPGDEIRQNNDSSPFIARYNAEGDFMWAYHLNDPDDTAMEEKIVRGIVVEADRVLAFFSPNPGSTPGAIIGKGGELSIPGNGIMMVSFDNLGTASLENVLTTSANPTFGPPEVLAATRLANGQYLIGGHLPAQTFISLEGTPLSSASTSGGDAFLVAINPDLTPAWGRVYREPGAGGGSQSISNIGVGEDGNTYVAGGSASQMVAGALGTVSGGQWLLQLDSAGTETWIAYGSYALSLSASNGGLVSCGHHAGPSVTPGQGIPVNLSSATGGLIWGLRPNGLHDWAQEYQLPGLMPSQYRCSLAHGYADGVLGAFSFRGTADLATNPLSSQGFSDVALFSLNDAGEVDYM